MPRSYRQSYRQARPLHVGQPPPPMVVSSPAAAPPLHRIATAVTLAAFRPVTHVVNTRGPQGPGAHYLQRWRVRAKAGHSSGCPAFPLWCGALKARKILMQTRRRPVPEPVCGHQGAQVLRRIPLKLASPGPKAGRSSRGGRPFS